MPLHWPSVQELLQKLEFLSFRRNRNSANDSIVRGYIFGQGKSRVDLLPVPHDTKYREEEVAERYISDQTSRGSTRFLRDHPTPTNDVRFVDRDASSSSSNETNDDNADELYRDQSLLATDGNIYESIRSLRRRRESQALYENHPHTDGSSQTIDRRRQKHAPVLQLSTFIKENETSQDVHEYENIQRQVTEEPAEYQTLFEQLHERDQSELQQLSKVRRSFQNTLKSHRQASRTNDYQNVRDSRSSRQYDSMEHFYDSVLGMSGHVKQSDTMVHPDDRSTARTFGNYTTPRSRRHSMFASSSGKPPTGRLGQNAYPSTPSNGDYNVSPTSDIAYDIVKRTAQSVKSRYLIPFKESDIESSDPGRFSSSTDVDNNTPSDIESTYSYKTNMYKGSARKLNKITGGTARAHRSSDDAADVTTIKGEVLQIVRGLKERFLSFGHVCSKHCAVEHSPQKRMHSDARETTDMKKEMSRNSAQGTTTNNKRSSLKKNGSTFEMLQLNMSPPKEGSEPTLGKTRRSAESVCKDKTNDVDNQCNGLQYRTFQFDVEKEWSKAETREVSDTSSESTSSGPDTTVSLVEALREQYARQELEQSGVNQSYLELSIAEEPSELASPTETHSNVKRSDSSTGRQTVNGNRADGKRIESANGVHEIVDLTKFVDGSCNDVQPDNNVSNMINEIKQRRARISSMRKSLASNCKTKVETSDRPAQLKESSIGDDRQGHRVQFRDQSESVSGEK